GTPGGGGARLRGRRADLGRRPHRGRASARDGGAQRLRSRPLRGPRYRARPCAGAAREDGAQASGALAARARAPADRPLCGARRGRAMTAAETTALPKKAGQVDLDRTRERLTKLGLVHAAESLATHVGTAV